MYVVGHISKKKELQQKKVCLKTQSLENSQGHLASSRSCGSIDRTDEGLVTDKERKTSPGLFVQCLSQLGVCQAEPRKPELHPTAPYRKQELPYTSHQILLCITLAGNWIGRGIVGTQPELEYGMWRSKVVASSSLEQSHPSW